MRIRPLYAALALTMLTAGAAHAQKTSPADAEIAKGRKAVREKNLDAAATAFQAAVSKDAQKAQGYLLLAQVQLEKGNLDAAIQTIADSRGKSGTDDVLSKIAFLKSDLMERKTDSAPGADNAPDSPLEAIAKKWQEVKKAWSDYATLVASKTNAPDYRASAEERSKKIDDRVKRDNDFGAVRKRIQDNEKNPP